MPPITVRLSDEAADALRSNAAKLGVSITALVEAMALVLDKWPSPVTSSSLEELARQIDFER